MSDVIEAFPLSWPVGKPRAHNRKGARFYQGDGSQPTLYTGLNRLREQLRMMGARDVVISTNVQTRRDGLPYSGAREPTDPGVAIWFRVDDEPHCLACDRWDRVADNLCAVAAHIDAIRGQARWGVGDLRQALGGYRALPAMGESAPWWRVLTFDQPPRQKAEAEARYYELLRKHHPDHGGNGNQAAEVTAAWREAERFYSQESR